MCKSLIYTYICKNAKQSSSAFAFLTSAVLLFKRSQAAFPLSSRQQASFLKLELSSQVQQRIEENLKRGLPAEAFARSTVEFGNEGCYLSLAEVLHINRLGTVFTD